MPLLFYLRFGEKERRDMNVNCISEELYFRQLQL